MFRRIRQCGTGVKRPDVPPSHVHVKRIGSITALRRDIPAQVGPSKPVTTKPDAHANPPSCGSR